MRFNEFQEGEYRVYVGALESPRGDGYTAAVVVNRARCEPGAPREAFRDEQLAGGHRWPTAQAALDYAAQRARELIRKQPERLAC